MEFIFKPWPWYVSGPLIGLMVPLLLIIGNKSFGISSSFRHLCAACLPTKVPFFNYNWKKEVWNLYFAFGLVIGGFIAAGFLSTNEAVVLNEKLTSDLAQYGISTASGLAPLEIFSWDKLFSLRSLIVIVLGGFLVGFGTRYAGGCTSGHAIMGLSNLQLPSLIAVCCFMAGGILTANFILPFILALS